VEPLTVRIGRSSNASTVPGGVVELEAALELADLDESCRVDLCLSSAGGADVRGWQAFECRACGSMSGWIWRVRPSNEEGGPRRGAAAALHERPIRADRPAA
jgi:hypothetical protein